MMKRFICILLFLLFILSIAYADYSAICTGQNVNVRVEAKSKAQSIGKLKKNDEFTVVSDEGDWCYIMCDLGEGYIPAKYVQVTSQLNIQSVGEKKTTAKTNSKITTKTGNAKTGSSQTATTSKNMTVTIKASCNNKNHVGNKWSYDFAVGDKICKKGSSTKVPMTAGQEIMFYSEITENDKYPDVGKSVTKYYVSEQDLKTGFTIQQQVEVMEDRGRYSGYSCYWDVTFTVKP